MAGDQFGEGGLAGAGRAVEDDARECSPSTAAGRAGFLGLEHAPEEFSGGEDVLLAGELVEGSRAHADGQRLDAADRALAFLGPEVRHGKG